MTQRRDVEFRVVVNVPRKQKDQRKLILANKAVVIFSEVTT